MPCDPRKPKQVQPTAFCHSHTDKLQLQLYSRSVSLKNYVRRINILSFADAGSSNITKLPIRKPLSCPELIFWIGKGYREERKKESK